MRTRVLLACCFSALTALAPASLSAADGYVVMIEHDGESNQRPLPRQVPAFGSGPSHFAVTGQRSRTCPYHNRSGRMVRNSYLMDCSA